MYFQSQLISTLFLGGFLMLWSQTTAEILNDDASLNALYNNLLQREYAEPVVFPNHQVERKAQRSPSRRLRFGRRNDPGLRFGIHSDPEIITHTAEKRWFDEVNQKPIRSPSLRLRFGRRSDPSMPLHSPLDMIMNEAYENQMERDLFDNDIDGNDVALANNEDGLYNSLMNTQKIRDFLMFLNKYGNEDNEGLILRAPASASTTAALEENMDEFERGIRKPAPLRLRWGRSTGGRLSSVQSNTFNTKNPLQPQTKATENSNEVEKTFDAQNKD